MSGGSYDYFFGRIRDFADQIEGQRDDPLRAAFAEHMRKVADAAFQIEWVDSGDKGEGDEHEAIRAVIGETGALEHAIKNAEKAKSSLEHEIEVAQSILAYDRK